MPKELPLPTGLPLPIGLPKPAAAIGHSKKYVSKTAAVNRGVAIDTSGKGHSGTSSSSSSSSSQGCPNSSSSGTSSSSSSSSNSSGSGGNTVINSASSNTQFNFPSPALFRRGTSSKNSLSSSSPCAAPPDLKNIRTMAIRPNTDNRFSSSSSSASTCTPDGARDSIERAIQRQQRTIEVVNTYYHVHI